MMNMNTTIPDYRVSELRERIDALIAKCDRKGLSGSISVVFGEREERQNRKQDSFGEWYTESTWWVPVTLECVPPAFNGWTFAAVIEQIEGAPAHVLRCSPSFDGRVPDNFRTCDPTHCDHCRKHRNRSETFVVYHAETGEFKQVGRQCMKDFLGHDPAALVASFGYISDAVDALTECAGECGCVFRTARSWTVEYILKLAARVVAVDGWKSRSADPMKCTANTISTYLFLGGSTNDQRMAAEFAATYQTTARVESLHARVMARAEELKAKTLSDMTSDYEANLWAIMHAGHCNSGHIGLVASMLAWAIKQENAEAAAKSSGFTNSVHVGTVGERLRDIPATVEFTKTIEGFYGATTIVKFNAGGNLLSWFASGSVDMKAGDQVTLTGTVKSHEQDQYMGCPVTVLSRCKVTVAQPVEH